MTHRVFIPLLVALCLMSAIARGDDAANALDSLQGTWELTAAVDGGMMVPADAVRGARVVFSQDRMTLISPDGKETTEYSITLDPTTTPKAIDITSTEGPFKGQAG